MNNLLSRLIAQAELSLAEVTRRTIDSTGDRIKAKGQDVVNEVMGTAAAAARAFAIKAGLAMFAGITLLVAVVLGLMALFRYLERLTGPIEALLILAGIFLALTLAAVVAMMVWPAGGGTKPDPDKARREVEDAARRVMAQTVPPVDPDLQAAAAAVAAEPESPGGSDQSLKMGFDAVVDALGNAGFRREQAGLRAGLMIANQLRPMQLVSLALLGGFLAGIRLTAPRKPRD